jgi:nickel-dependent lactate racemase
MSRQTYHIPYSKTTLEFSLPPSLNVTIAEPRVVEPAADALRAIHEALAYPIGSPTLRELARHGDRACIVFTDITRTSPDHLLVPALLTDLEAAGVKDEDITLLCATGVHRPSTPEEKVLKLGPEVATRYRVIDNDPQNPAALVELGVTSKGIPVQVHRAAAEADVVIATGIVDTHQYAGYSGGCKTLAVGAAGEPLIA